MTDSSDLKVADEPMDGDETPTCGPKPYGRITQVLRAAMESDGWANSTTYCVKLSVDMDAFNALCDDVDALHKALEDENASLREQNAKLRETVAEHARSNVEAVTSLDRLGDAVKKFDDLNLWGVDYVAYPVGCDMRTICPRCKVDGYGRTHTVMQLNLNIDGSWSLVNDRGDTYHDMAAFAHHQPDVKDTLLEMIGELMSTPMNKLRADELAEKYAKNFTLAEDCEDGDDDE